jgi:hypothetical protein
MADSFTICNSKSESEDLRAYDTDGRTLRRWPEGQVE